MKYLAILKCDHPWRRAYSFGVSHIGFHTAGRIVSCSVVMLTRFPTICDYRQSRSPLEKGLLTEDYLTWTFMPLRRIVPLRGTLSCAFGATLLQGPTRWGLSHMGFHTAGKIVSCSVVMLTRFPTICDYRQTRSPLEKGAAKGRDRRKHQLSNFCLAGEGNC